MGYIRLNSIILFLVCIHYFCNGTELSSEKNVDGRKETFFSSHMGDGYSGDTPQAKGIILKFHQWPSSNERVLISEQAQKDGLKVKVEIQRFNVWVFEWTKLYEATKVKNVCKNFTGISSLKSCEPDYLALFSADHTASIENTVRSLVDNSLKSCSIVTSDLNLFKGQLSDYWAQEAVGADLLKKKLQKLSLPEKHLVELFDVSQEDHSTGVRNLISDEGEQAVVPELKDSISVSQTPYSSDLLIAVDRLLNKADNKCDSSIVSNDNNRNIASNEGSDSGGGGQQATPSPGPIPNLPPAPQSPPESVPNPSPAPLPSPVQAPQPSPVQTLQPSPVPTPQPSTETSTSPIQESEDQGSSDFFSLSNDDLKYVKRSELGYLKQAMKDKAHSKSWRDVYMSRLRQLIDSRKECNITYHDMYNGIEKTFRIYQGNLDWVKKNGITGMTVTHMKIQGKSLMDIRNTATPEEIEAKIAKVQEHIDNLKKEALRLASANGILDYSVIQKPEPGKIPGVKEYVRLSRMSSRIATPWRTYQQKKSRLNSLEPQTRTRRSSYPLPNDWGDVSLDE